MFAKMMSPRIEATTMNASMVWTKDRWENMDGGMSLDVKTDSRCECDGGQDCRSLVLKGVDQKGAEGTEPLSRWSQDLSR